MSLRRLLKPLIINAMLMHEWWQSGISYNPISSQAFNNPYPVYNAYALRIQSIGVV